MEETINALSENHKQLESEWEEQFEKFKMRLGKKRASLFSQEQQIRAKIHKLENRLEELVSSSKNKLKSTSKFSEDKRRERDEKLKLVFENLPTTLEELIAGLEEIKDGLSKKLTEEEINNLYQVKKTLADLKQELATLQEQQQAQIETLPK